MIYFSKDQWLAINRQKSPAEIICEMSQSIVTDGVEFPFEEVDDERLKRDFSSLCCCDDVMRVCDWTTKFENEFCKLRLVVGLKQSGMLVSNHFCQRQRYRVDHREIQSCLSSWNDPASHPSLLSTLWVMGGVSEVTPRILRQRMKLRKYVASQFRPSAAKAVFDHPWSESQSAELRVLDFSSGWGDRLVGALASPRVCSYFGVDPNAELMPCYEGILSGYNVRGIDVGFKCGCAEEVNYEGRRFNFIFTSPPYFKTEKYDGVESSWRRYKRADDWLEGFLFAALARAWDALDELGIMIINIADVYDTRRDANGRRLRVELCVPMVHFVNCRLQGSVFLGQFCYALKKMPGQHLHTATGEPCFVWQKKK